MPKFIFNTSPSGALKIGEGLALFANNQRAANWGGEYSEVLFDFYTDSWWHEISGYLRFTAYAGFQMGYAVNSFVDANIEYNANNLATKGTFSFGGTQASGKDGFAAGIKIGFGVAISFNFYIDIPFIPTFSLELSVNLDAIGFLLSLAFGLFGSGAKDGRASADGGLNLFGESIAGLSNNGASQAFMGITMKLNLLNLIPSFATFNISLKKAYSSVAAGVVLRVGTNVNFQPTEFWYQRHGYTFPSSMSSSVVVDERNIKTYPFGYSGATFLKVKHTFTFTIHLGFYADVSVFKFISLGTELTYDMLRRLNLLERGEKFNRITSGGTIASAPSGQKPRVVFHKS
ncbi:MAG: hypothetical protein RLZZ156_1898 [Deinococcota bacterium]|jgi:hypothetical protein